MLCAPIQATLVPANQDVWDQYEDCEYFEDWNLTDDKYADEPPYYVHLGMPMIEINKRTLEDGAQIYLKQVIHSGFFTAWVQRANEKGVVEWLFPLEWDAAMIIFPDLEGKFSKYAMVDPFYGY